MINTSVGIGGGARVLLDESNCIVIRFDEPRTQLTVTNVDHLCEVLRQCKTLQPVNDELIRAEHGRTRHEAQP